MINTLMIRMAFREFKETIGHNKGIEQTGIGWRILHKDICSYKFSELQFISEASYLQNGRYDMSHVFISYSHEETRAATDLAKSLEQLRIPLWWDPKIRLGEPFSPAIMEALQQASAIIVLWSRSSVKSSWVIDEARIGAQRRVLLPVLLDRVTPPAEFAKLDCANLVDWDRQKPHREFDQLRRRLLSLFPRGDRGEVRGRWHVERLNKDTLAVRLDHERHTIQYSKGHVYVDGELARKGVASVIDERKYPFEISDGGVRYFAELTVWVTAFRGDVKKLALMVGGTALYEG
jgi:hypothetical protein